MRIASILENQEIEKRISITPEVAKKYLSLGFEVVLSENYGAHLGIQDKEYIDQGIVKFEHHSFPLDLAALNAEIIIRCHTDNNKKFQLLGEIYKKQSQWAVGSDINVINESIKKIALDSGLSNDKIDSCLNNEIAQDEILNERIEAQKKYKIQSTPTIYINKKQYKGKHEYKSFKKAIEKFL